MATSCLGRVAGSAGLAAWAGFGRSVGHADASAVVAGFACTMSIMPLPSSSPEAHDGVVELDVTPASGPATLLLVGPERPYGLTLRRCRWWARVAARVLAPLLDRRLAQGRAPESNMLLAVRALVLVSPRSRRRDAETLGDVVRRASGPAVTRSPRTPLNRKAVGDCAADMAEVRSRLSAPGPVSARGVALVGKLL